jgi:hypothetical protein
MAKGPRRVYLIRHAEKLGLSDVADDAEDPNWPNTGPDLSARGSARAAALPALFTPVTQELACAITETRTGAEQGCALAYRRIGYAGMAPRFVPPDVIVAAAASTHSNRPVETVTPVAASLGLPVRSPFKDKRYADLANALRTDPGYDGKIVLICWHHGHLAALAGELGVTGLAPWPGTVFDRLWLLDYAGTPPAFTDCPQALLFGDSAS